MATITAIKSFIVQAPDPFNFRWIPNRDYPTFRPKSSGGSDQRLRTLPRPPQARLRRGKVYLRVRFRKAFFGLFTRAISRAFLGLLCVRFHDAFLGLFMRAISCCVFGSIYACDFALRFFWSLVPCLGPRLLFGIGVLSVASVSWTLKLKVKFWSIKTKQGNSYWRERLCTIDLLVK